MWRPSARQEPPGTVSVVLLSQQAWGLLTAVLLFCRVGDGGTARPSERQRSHRRRCEWGLLKPGLYEAEVCSLRWWRCVAWKWGFRQHRVLRKPWVQACHGGKVWECQLRAPCSPSLTSRGPLLRDPLEHALSSDCFWLGPRVFDIRCPVLPEVISYFTPLFFRICRRIHMT